MPLPSFASFHRRQLWAFRLELFREPLHPQGVQHAGHPGPTRHPDGPRPQPRADAGTGLEVLPAAGDARRTVEEGTRELLEELHRVGLRLGVISNTFVPGATLDRRLAQAKLLDLLPVRVYSCDAIHRKPSPEIFQLRCGGPNWIPSQTLFVGDSLEADIEGREQGRHDQRAQGPRRTGAGFQDPAPSPHPPAERLAGNRRQYNP